MILRTRSVAALGAAALVLSAGALGVAHAAQPEAPGITVSGITVSGITVSGDPELGPAYTQANWPDVMAASAHKPTLVLFTMSGCSMCNQQKPHLKKAYANANGAWTLGQVDTIAERGLQKQYDAKYRPTLMMFKDGKEIDRKVGFYGVPGFLAWIEYTVKHWNGGPYGPPVDPDEPPSAVGKPGTPGGGPVHQPGNPGQPGPAPTAPQPPFPQPTRPQPTRPPMPWPTGPAPTQPGRPQPTRPPMPWPTGPAPTQPGRPNPWPSIPGWPGRP